MCGGGVGVGGVPGLTCWGGGSAAWGVCGGGTEVGKAGAC